MPTKKKVALAVVRELTDHEKFAERKRVENTAQNLRRARVRAGLENANASVAVKSPEDYEKFVERKKAEALAHMKKRERVHAGLENANA